MGFFEEQYIPHAPEDRVDGKLKVTGAAKFAAEFTLNKMVYGVLVGSTIARGKITAMNTAAAQKAPGVLAVITHENAEKIPAFADAEKARELELGLRIFHTSEIFSNGQPIALVVADTLEQAQHAALMVTAQYETETATVNFEQALAGAKKPENSWNPDITRGDAEAWKKAPVRIENEYHIPVEVHNPMEMHATIAYWESPAKLVVYDKNHAVKDVQKTIADAFGLAPANVQVNAEFVGGGFGSGLRVWPHCFAAIMAAKQLNRPVKIMLSRPQMFTMVGYRPRSWQKIAMGAETDGRITGIVHEATGNTSFYEPFTENITGLSKMLYQCENVQTVYKTVQLNLATPIWMRAPGEATGAFALESAIDELAYKLNMDPLALRLKNFAEKNPENNLPWSSNFLKECYQQGAAAFGWEKRNPAVRASKQGNWWVGMGMGTGTWTAFRLSATARGILDRNGFLTLQSATSDMGPGTATAMMAIARDVLGLPERNIKFELGRSNLADSPAQGGSFTTASVGSAVHDVCSDIKKKLVELAIAGKNSPFKGMDATQLELAGGLIFQKDQPAPAGKSLSIAELMAAQKDAIEITKTSERGEERKKYAFNSFAAHFAEVKVHAETGVVRVTRFVSAVDAGKIINTKTATSQVKGAIAGAIGMALMEIQETDMRNGRLLGNDLAGYHIPAHADMPEAEVLFINQPDPYLNKMGSKGLGEVGLIGSAAAIVNAIYHATGKRITRLPVTPDKLL
ncbi:MAG: xanthine dehydrogenase family protein molybdopterin-binding subunit [Dinghuibacter sp.]|nr:xanthine dehydrogenase family protein molybdopterin-binding subunit [Dinghuibacter sp.]